MSDNSIIKVEGLSKHYLLNKSLAQKNDTLFGSLVSNIKNIKQLTQKKESVDFWALNDVSFEIKQGDRVGIIGRNGAGKSTLLKILSRITPPTKGRIEINGKVASLLEVGTGFHGDLSGRENIYLNGSILGMSKQEIDRKFDEIVGFSEVENFLDTPVKRYSSGMYVRLAFSVAAHLDSDVLIVDEVLAVGDASFQKKCLKKMEDVSKNGRTILFVSHHMASVQHLCNTGIYLNNGKLVNIGTIDSIISKYTSIGQENANLSLDERKDRSGNQNVIFKSIQLLDKKFNPIISALSGDDIIIEVLIEAKSEISQLQLALGIDNLFGVRVAHMSNETLSYPINHLNKGLTKIYFNINRLPFKNGRYNITLFVMANLEIADWIQDAGFIDVENGDFYKTGRIVPEGQGDFLLDYSINIK